MKLRLTRLTLFHAKATHWLNHSIFLYKQWRLLSLLVCIPLILLADEKPNSKSMHIRPTAKPIKIDGILSDSAWLHADLANDFIQTFPYDTSLSATRTEVKMTYDDKYVYVAAWMYDTLMHLPYVVQSMKRDWSYPVSDAFVISIDPFNDKTNGFSFGVNPLGAQREGLIANGGGFGVSTDWDNKWYSEVGRFEHGWTAEFAIPFKTLRFKGGEMNWGINFHRNNLKINENSCWNRVPRVFNISSLVFAGNLHWDKPLKKPGLNYAVIPYAIGMLNKDYDNHTQNQKWNIGFDAKLGITPSLNLDITVNPDFAQVEVDRQVINLSRYSLFYPERRQFFIENSDLFANFGFRQIRPFFSRRIGLEQSPEGNVNVPIIGGLRLSGKLNNQWRIGVMDVQTARYATGSSHLNPTNFSVISVQRKLFTASNIGFIFVNQEKYSNGSDLYNRSFNRVGGIEYNLQSNDKMWMGKAFYMKSFSTVQSDYADAHATWLSFNTTHVNVEWNHEYVGRGFDAQTGFVPHTQVMKVQQDTAGQYHYSTVQMSYWRLEPYASYKWYPQSKHINNIEFGMYGSMYYDSSFQSNDAFWQPGATINFQNSASVGIYLDNFYNKLYYATDLTGNGDMLKPGDYSFRLIELYAELNKRKPFNANINFKQGSFYTGNRTSINAGIGYRHQPWGTYSLSVTYEKLHVATGNSTQLWLIGPQAELSFSRKVYFSTFVQYNSQAMNMNINSRLQWRFAPMSDFFIVYTDNYGTPSNASIHNWMLFDQLYVKNRTLVVKLVYWFNG